MEMFVLSYVNVPQTLSSSWFYQMTQSIYSDIVPLIYVNKTICLVICPSTRFKSIILMAMDELSGAILNSKTILSFH